MSPGGGLRDAEMIRDAVFLAGEGRSYRQIGDWLGVHESQVRRTPEVREARVKADPNAHSVSTRTNTVACRVQPAFELISRVEWTIASLLGADYRLSPNDSRRLERILRAGLEGLTR